MELRRIALTLVALVLSVRAFATASWVSERFKSDSFPLAVDGVPAPIIASAEDFEVVQVAAHDLAKDLGRVTGRDAEFRTQSTDLNSAAVLVGTLGHSALVDDLVARGKIDVTDLRGKWESFVITTVTEPMPGVPSALVIIGSDRRGTAFGIYELSQAIGVSPWYWWADVTPETKFSLFVSAGTRRFGPPSVQYRGIFLNDEDWGLQKWAAKTFEPEVGDIGPKTYAKICELLLRLKANTLWPAMHPCTKAFNLYPQNKLVADRYAIVMGSSHAEPMLRNNVTEWTAPHEDYNYVTNRDGVRAYWEQRVQDNGKFENIYTLGMRGIHDSNMQGPKTDAERIATLEQIFADQRAMIAKHVRPEVEQVPQMFCAYKEVLDLYRQGLKVPDDVTIVWPDDNFGYVRNFATPEEQKRSGGFGVYYHISYLGRPLSYLWLNTTPPALIWEEMNKAYEHGAHKIWIVNVGDLKPAEIGTEFFLQMAWDIKRWNQHNVQDFLVEWAAREFGQGYANPIAKIMSDYYTFNFVRKPEHLQWWLPKQPAQASTLTDIEVKHRLEEAERLKKQIEPLVTRMLPEKRDAFFQLVEYPVLGSALANERYFLMEMGAYKEAPFAHRQLEELTERFNTRVNRAKWKHFIALEPASDEWASMRIAEWKALEFPPKSPPTQRTITTIKAGSYKKKTDRPTVAWKSIAGLGHNGDAVTLTPSNASSTVPTKLSTEAPCLSYEINFLETGTFTLTTYLLPTHPLITNYGLRFAMSLDDAPPQMVVCAVPDGSAEWAQGVLNNYVTVNTPIKITEKGRHTLTIYGVDAGVVLDKFVITTPVVPAASVKP